MAEIQGGESHSQVQVWLTVTFAPDVESLGSLRHEELIIHTTLVRLARELTVDVIEFIDGVLPSAHGSLFIVHTQVFLLIVLCHSSPAVAAAIPTRRRRIAPFARRLGTPLPFLPVSSVLYSPPPGAAKTLTLPVSTPPVKSPWQEQRAGLSGASAS